MAPPAETPPDDELHQALLALLRRPELPGIGEPGATTAFPRAGLFLGLLGFDDPSSSQQEMAAECYAELQRQSLCVLARPIGLGGLLVALASCCQEVGCAVVLPAPRHVGAGEPPGLRQQLFHETAGRYVLCIPADRQADARILAAEHGVPLWPLGRTGGRELVVRASDGASGFREVVRVGLGALADTRQGQ